MRDYNLSHVKRLYNPAHTAHMVRMRMSSHNVVNSFNSSLLQIGDNTVGIGCLAAVNEHGCSAGCKKNGVSLSDINKMNCKPVISGKNRLTLLLAEVYYNKSKQDNQYRYQYFP